MHRCDKKRCGGWRRRRRKRGSNADVLRGLCNWNLDYFAYLDYCTFIWIISLFLNNFLVDWLATVGSRMLYNSTSRIRESTVAKTVTPKLSMSGIGGQDHRKASGGPSWRHRNHSVRHGRKLSGCTWRQPPGSRRWMPTVVS